MCCYCSDPGSNARRLTQSNWNQLELNFDPAAPSRSSIISINLEASSSLTATSVLEFVLPGLVLESSHDADKIEFDVILRKGPSANLFAYYATWYAANSSLIFQLASAFPIGTAVTLQLPLGTFRLPAVSVEDSASYQAQVKSRDGSTIMFPMTSFLHSDPVHAAIEFVTSSLSPTLDGLSFTFALNRGVFAGDVIQLQLPGYIAASNTAPILYSADSDLFEDDEAVFTPSNFTYSLTLAKPRAFDGSGSDTVSITLRSITLPAGQSENDPSLRAVVVPWDLEAIKLSPKFGVKKTFQISELSFEPIIPEAGTAISISFQSTVELFSGTIVYVHLRGGFSRSLGNGPVLIYGDFASNFSATWNGSALALTVQSDAVVPSTVRTDLWIRVQQGFVLPKLLSANDGVLLIESRGLVHIGIEAIKTSPKIGLISKLFSNQTISFSPADPNSLSAVTVTFSSNVDLLPGTLVHVHLGGFVLDGPLVISGDNSTVFSIFFWSENAQDLELTVADFTTINSSSIVSITMLGFRLPTALSANDRSVHLRSPMNGIADPKFFPSVPRINDLVEKGFLRSELWYGSTDMPFPGRPGNVSIRLKPSFAILSRTNIVLDFPGFSVAPGIGSEIIVSTSPRSGVVSNGTWNGSALVVTVIDGSAIAAEEVITISVENHQFVTPLEKSQNDPSLGIELAGAQILSRAPIKNSIPVIPRRFLQAELTVSPSVPKSVAGLTIMLESTVPVPRTDSFEFGLKNFLRAQGNISVTDSLGLNCSGIWEPTTFILTVVCDNELSANTEIVLTVSENQGFVLPRAIALNSNLITIAVPGSISVSPFLASPPIGAGPYVDQQYCMHRFDSGVRVHVMNAGLFPDLADCGPGSCSSEDWITDACSTIQLERCGCSNLLPDLGTVKPDFPVFGFNLASSDRIFFVKKGDPCSGTGLLDIQQIGEPATTVAGGLVLPTVRALSTGQYSVCLDQTKLGTLTVRAACSSPSVGYNGGCHSFCPYGMVPVLGQCQHLSYPQPDRPVGFQLGLQYPNGDNLQLGSLPKSDPVREFFAFTFQDRMHAVLNEPGDSERVEVIAVRAIEGLVDTVLVAAVVKPSSGTGRPSSEIIALLESLFFDEYSNLWTDSLFANTVRSVGFKINHNVRYCESGGEYRLGGCPPSRDWGAPTGIPDWYWLAVIIGGIVGGLVMAGTALALYRLDSTALRISLAFKKKPKSDEDNGSNDFSVVKIAPGNKAEELNLEITKDLGGMDHGAKIEFAKTWLEGQLLDEPLILKRRNL